MVLLPLAWPHFEAPWARVNGFISLSNWVPTASDPTVGYYQTLIKYGKLGESFAQTDQPFKNPLLMLEAGSVFYSDDPARDWYGHLIPNIAPHHPEIVQYGFAFAVPTFLLGVT